MYVYLCVCSSLPSPSEGPNGWHTGFWWLLLHTGQPQHLWPVRQLLSECALWRGGTCPGHQAPGSLWVVMCPCWPLQWLGPGRQWHYTQQLTVHNSFFKIWKYQFSYIFLIERCEIDEIFCFRYDTCTFNMTENCCSVLLIMIQTWYNIWENMQTVAVALLLLSGSKFSLSSTKSIYTLASRHSHIHRHKYTFSHLCHTICSC